MSKLKNFRLSNSRSCRKKMLKNIYRLRTCQQLNTHKKKVIGMGRSRLRNGSRRHTCGSLRAFTAEHLDIWELCLILTFGQQNPKFNQLRLLLIGTNRSKYVDGGLTNKPTNWKQQELSEKSSSRIIRIRSLDESDICGSGSGSLAILEGDLGPLCQTSPKFHHPAGVHVNHLNQPRTNFSGSEQNRARSLGRPNGFSGEEHKVTRKERSRLAGRAADWNARLLIWSVFIAGGIVSRRGRGADPSYDKRKKQMNSGPITHFRVCCCQFNIPGLRGRGDQVTGV